MSLDARWASTSSGILLGLYCQRTPTVFNMHSLSSTDLLSHIA